MLDNLILLQKIVLSLVIGALVGLEREKSARGRLVEGMRTFMLVSVLGMMSGFFSNLLNSIFPVLIAFLSTVVLTILGFQAKIKKKIPIGLTTEMAFILTFLIGLTIFYESYPYFISVSLGIILTFILVSKERLHGFAKNLKKKEIWEAIIFAIITFVILPVLPRYPVDPFGALNPYLIWLSLVLVLSISFAGYIAIKVFGVKKGLTLTGLFGGLAGSTAVSISMAENVKRNKRILYSATFAVIIASSTMFLRAIFVSSIMNYDTGLLLLLPLSIIGFSGYSLSYLSWRKSLKERPTIDIGSPLALKPAVKFTLFFIIVLLFSKLAQNHFGHLGVYLVAVVAGLVDVDALTVSLSSLSLTSLSPFTAVNGIILACLSNTASKWLLVNWLGTKKMGVEVGKVFGVLLVVGAFILLLLV